MNYSLNLQLIKEQRIKKKLTLEEMAHCLGLSGKSDYFKRENGDTKFKTTELPILSNKLGIPFEKFFNHDVEKIETKWKDRKIWEGLPCSEYVGGDSMKITIEGPESPKLIEKIANGEKSFTERVQSIYW